MERFGSIREIWRRLDAFYDEHGLRSYEKYRDEAILSAAVLFFVRWFLEEFDRPEVQEKLLELGELLQRRPIGHFDEFCKNALGPVLLAIRENDFNLARELYTSHDATSSKLESLRAKCGSDLPSSTVVEAFGISEAGNTRRSGTDSA